MPYATQANLIDRFSHAELIQLTDRPDRADPENAGTIDSSVLNQAIADADAEINSYLTAYPLPLAVVPANLLRIACDITRYYLYDDQMPDLVLKHYKDAIDWLKLVAAGKIKLPPDVLGNVPVTASDDVDFQTQDSVFTPNTLSGF
jgi:phage gp36-like protein